MVFKVNGENVPSEEMDMGDAIHMNMVVGVTDKYVETKEGKPLDLLRTFDEMSLDARAGDEKHAVEEFKAIEGKTVRFKWNEESKAYDKSFHESKGDDDTIAALDDDMDLRVLLPEKKVAEGETWEVPANHLMQLFMPGGLVGVPHSGEEGEAFQIVHDEFKTKLAPALKDLKVTCKYKGLHEDGGKKYGEIRFSFDGKAKLDLSDLAARMAAIGETDGPKPDVDTQVDLALKGEGSLDWDQAAGVMHAFEMQADLSAGVQARVKADVEDQHLEYTMKGDVLGKAKWELAAKK
jgi:hypothetical protein